LRFGDFTNDGKTDVVAVVLGKWRMLTKHSGVEQWTGLHPSLSGSLAGVVVADFTGDGIADLARSANDWWWISTGGKTMWTKLKSAKIPGIGTIVNLMGFSVGRFYDGNATADVVFWSGATGLRFDYAPRWPRSDWSTQSAGYEVRSYQTGLRHMSVKCKLNLQHQKSSLGSES
jgi:hypothetical protein